MTARPPPSVLEGGYTAVGCAPWFVVHVGYLELTYIFDRACSTSIRACCGRVRVLSVRVCKSECVFVSVDVLRILCLSFMCTYEYDMLISQNRPHKDRVL